VTEYATVVGTQSRVLRTLGLKRIARDVNAFRPAGLRQGDGRARGRGMNIIQALDDSAVFGPWFKSKTAGAPGEHSSLRCSPYPWIVPPVPDHPATESWLIVGRRGGKSFVLAVVAVSLLAFRDWRPHLAPGERATVMVIAADRTFCATSAACCGMSRCWRG
jgi:hypothetical protein